MTTRFRVVGLEEIESPRIDAFLAAVEKLSREHGLSISHEDGHGAFIVGDLDESDIQWLNAAHDGTEGRS